MSKEKIESVLALLGAGPSFDGWRLHRLNREIYTPLDGADTWLLIGEITEALREKGVWSIDTWWIEGCTHLSVYDNLEDGDLYHKYESEDSLLDCYLQAAEELLGEEVI